jgi:hypothetical protein
LLYAYKSMLPAIFEWDEGIRAALEGTKAQPVEFFTEFLDLVNFPDESYVHSLVDFLRVKYRNQKIDLLIPVGSSAFSFLKAHGNALFPGTPIVFCYVPKLQVEAQKLPPNSTGVMGWVDVQGTLAAALTLRPGTRRVVLVGGAGKVERHYQNIAREALRPYEGQFEITFLTDLPYPKFSNSSKTFPPKRSSFTSRSLATAQVRPSCPGKSRGAWHRRPMPPFLASGKTSWARGLSAVISQASRNRAAWRAKWGAGC